MKILENKYPLGSIPGQRTPGRYIDGALHENIKILARNIANDMTFMMVISSSTLEVGTGKSTLAQQICEDYTDLVNQYHGTNLEFTTNNIVWRPKELIERAFKVPKYSALLLDEWDDLHYWSELGISLRQFFRKCRQLNLFMIIICPNFFQLPMAYAVSRSIAFIDVKFEGEFQRGFFAFYNFEKKKNLYIFGKKTLNYHATKPDFNGRFLGGYAVDKDEYLKAKRKDTDESEHRVKPVDERAIKVKIFKRLTETLPEVTKKRLAEAFGIGERTSQHWLHDENEEIQEQSNLEMPIAPVI